MPVDPSNAFSIGSVKFEALGDRIIIREDEFRSGYECPNCRGSGVATCPECNGTGLVMDKFKCSHCQAGRIPCPDCGGKGGLIVVPDTAQRRPTSGTIVSVGPSVKHLKVGDSIMFSSFAGYHIELDGADLCILHETEILCRIEGHLDVRRVRGKSEIASYAS